MTHIIGKHISPNAKASLRFFRPVLKQRGYQTTYLMSKVNNQTKSLALELFHVLHVNQLHYSIKDKSWVGAVPNSDQLKTITYVNIVKHSAMFLSGITKEQTNTRITRLLLEQIQAWVEISEGGIFQVFNGDVGAMRFIPACLQETYPKV